MGLVGQVLHGQFRVDQVVVDDARSVLYRGHHLMLEVPIALKCMKPPRDAETAEAMIRRFRHESRLHYKLAQGNPNIVRVLASGTAAAAAGLCPFMVREWHEGRSLAHDLAARRAAGAKGRDLASAVRLLTPAVDALVYVHACGVIHRAVTPEHLFVAKTREGERLLVLDFGVAKVVSDHADLAPASQSMGFASVETPAYAAPEQIHAGIGAPGPWTDIYALAILLLEALRDRPVFDEGGAPLPLRVIDPAKRPTPRALGLGLPANVDALLQSAVQVDPKLRPADLAEFWREIRESAAVAASALPPSTERGVSTARGPTASAVPTVARPSANATPTGRSPLAHSDVGDTSPPPSSNIEEATQIMRAGELLDSLAQGDAEPVAREAQLFVAAPAPAPPGATAARPTGKKHLVTMVSPGQEEVAEALRAPLTVADPRVVDAGEPQDVTTAKMRVPPAIVPTQPMTLRDTGGKLPRLPESMPPTSSVRSDLPGAFSSEPLPVVPPPAAPVVVAPRPPPSPAPQPAPPLAQVQAPRANPAYAQGGYAPQYAGGASSPPAAMTSTASSWSGPSIAALVVVILVLLGVLGAATVVLLRIL